MLQFFLVTVILYMLGSQLNYNLQQNQKSSQLHDIKQVLL